MKIITKKTIQRSGIMTASLLVAGATIVSTSGAASATSSAGGTLLQNGNAFGTSLVIGTNDSNSLSLETNNVSYFKLETSGLLQGANNATLSVPGTGPRSERFGQNTVASSFATALGYGANAGLASVAIGQSAIAKGGSSLAIGSGAASSNLSLAIGSASNTNTAGAAIALGFGSEVVGEETIAIGTSSYGYGANSVAVGTLTVVGANNAVALGANSFVPSGANNSIAIGNGAFAGSPNQFVVGSNSSPITDVFIGGGANSINPKKVTFHGTNAASTNVAGGNLVMAAGQSTGFKNGGSFIVQTSAANIEGSSPALNPLQNRLEINSDGLVRLNAYTEGVLTSDVNGSLLSTKQLELSDLKVTGVTELATLEVGGNTTVNNLLVNGMLSVIRVIGSEAAFLDITSNGNLNANNIKITATGKISGNIFTRGKLPFTAGATAAQYNFPTPFDTVPNVIATPIGNPGGAYWLSNVTKQYFTINLANPAPAGGIEFNVQFQQ